MLRREGCRKYADRPVARETLEKLVEVACLAPSGCNAQPWRYLIVDEPEAKAKLVEALDDEGLTGCPWGASVPAFLLVVEQPATLMPGVAERYGSQKFAQMDIGMSAMCLTLAAADMGLGTCMIGTMHQEKMHAAFGIPADRPIRLAIAVGYDGGSGVPRKKQRRPVSESTGYNHW